MVMYFGNRLCKKIGGTCTYRTNFCETGTCCIINQIWFSVMARLSHKNVDGVMGFV